MADPVIHAPVRLQIMTYLAVEEKAGFTQLKKITGTTQGNLSAHLAKLEHAGYVRIRKSFRNRRPYTQVAITPKGRRALEEYIQWMRRVLNEWDAREQKAP